MDANQLQKLTDLLDVRYVQNGAIFRLMNVSQMKG